MIGVWIKNGITTTLVIIAISTGLFSSLVHARSGGVGLATDVEPDGYSTTCTQAGCHSGGSYNAGNPIFAGSTSVAIGSTTAYSVRANNSNAVRNGFSASVRNGSGTRQGSFTESDADVIVGATNDFVTHPSPRTTGTTFSFNWIAPTSPVSVNLWACINQVDNTGGTGGDGPAQCDSYGISVTNTNPVANPDAKSVSEDSTTTIQVKNNNGSGADNDGDAAVVQTLSVTNINRSDSVGNGSVVESATDGFVTYDPSGRFETLDYNDTTTDVFTYTLSDGINTATGTVTMTINGVNDAPTISASAAITYTEVQPPVAKVIDTGITVGDVDNGATIQSATVSITNNGEVEDVLACGAVAAGISCSGSYPTLTLTSATTNSLTEYRNALRAVTFKNTSLNPTSNTRTITFQVTDDRNQVSNTDTATVAVASVSFKPTIAGFTGTATFNENGSVAVDGGVTLGDPDGSALNQALISLTNIKSGDSLVCPGGAFLATGMSCGYVSPTITISSASNNTFAQYETAIENVAFTNSSEDPDETLRSVTLVVRDTGNTSSDIASKSIDVNAVNDPPAIVAPFAGTTATEGSAFNYTPTVSDPDDSAAGYSFTITGNPGGTFNTSTGAFSWTPPRTGMFGDPIATITIDVEDGNEDGSNTPDSVDINLIVNPPDGDADSVATYADNCPSTPNGAAGDNQADNDADTQYVANAGFPAIGDVDPSDPLTGGDSCDTDDDNDGMPDAFENMFAFLDPLNAADAALDQDGDGLTNLQEYNNDNTGATIAVDSVGPTVTVPADVTVNATGFLTTVDIGTATATDGNDGSVSTIVAVVSPDTISTCSEMSNFSSVPDPFRPGAHAVTWATCDSAGNLASATQTVNVRPILGTTSGQVIGEGQVATVTVFLNGDAPIYPVTVDYVLGGSTATIIEDHDALSGTITIADPDINGNTPGRAGTLDINIVSDGLAEADETIVLTLQNSVNAVLGMFNVNTVTITDTNIAPLVDINVDQNSVDVGSTIEVGGAATVVNILAGASDANGDVLTYDWSATDNALTAIATVNNDMFDMSAASLMTLPIGLYTLSVDVSDGSVITTSSMLLVARGPVITILPAGIDSDGDGLDDDDPLEGFIDSDGDGIANYLDNAFTPSNAIENQTGNLGNSFIIETDPGLDIRKGTTALAAGVDGVLISQSQLEANGGQAGGVVINGNDDLSNSSGLYDFEIHGLNTAISSANVVIPLPAALQANSIYRKYNTVDGWYTFVENANNVVRSASGELGVCPEPGSTEFTAGLTVLHYCVQLTIEDGGPNDADKTRNFVIKDPGGVAIEETPEAVTPQADGRIGVMHPLLLLIMLLPFAYVYRVQRQREWSRIVGRHYQSRR